MPLRREGPGEDCHLGCLPQNPRVAWCAFLFVLFCSLTCATHLCDLSGVPGILSVCFLKLLSGFPFPNFCFKMLVQGHMLDTFFHD
jgi:apolipoprotein N-acyltransferase